MRVYHEARKDGDFEVERSARRCRRMLVSPRFLFRFEQAPRTTAADQNYRISEFELASRLSSFLWATCRTRR